MPQRYYPKVPSLNGYNSYTIVLFSPTFRCFVPYYY